MRISLVLAADESNLIGADGGLPWHLPEDLKRFRALTTGHVVVAGRKTQDSIVARLGRSLPDRTTVVVTRRSTPDTPDTLYRPSVAAALAAAAHTDTEEVFVIGGAEIYRQVLPAASTVHLTRVRGTHTGDTYLPADWLEGFHRTEVDDRGAFTFETWVRA